MIETMHHFLKSLSILTITKRRNPDIHRLMNGFLKMVYTYGGILFRLYKEGNLVTYFNMDEL